MQASFITEAVVAAAGDLGYYSLKEQLKVVTACLEGRDVFAVLPTGYEKSLCFGCLPLAFHRLNSTRGLTPASIVVVGCHSTVNITFITAAFELRSQPGTYQLDLS